MTREERRKREKRRQILIYTGLGLMVVCVLGAVLAMTHGFFFQSHVQAGETEPLGGDNYVNSDEMIGFRPGDSLEAQVQPAPTAEEVEEFWSDSAFVGDSIIAGFGLYLWDEGQQALGNPTIIALTGYSLHDALQPAGSVSHPEYEGQERTIFESLSMRKPSKIVLSFGINDLGRDNLDQIVENYDEVIRRVREVCPEAQIYVMSCTYVFEGREGGNRTNDNIRELNRRMEEYGEENKVGFINIAPYLADENGSLYSAYTRDFYVHLNEEAYATWVQVLRRYAYWQICGKEAPEEMFPITMPAAVPEDQIPSGTIAYDPPEYTVPATAAPPVTVPGTEPAESAEESSSLAEETEGTAESQPAGTVQETSSETAQTEESKQEPESTAAAEKPSETAEATLPANPPASSAAETPAASTAAPSVPAVPTAPNQDVGKNNPAESPAA